MSKIFYSFIIPHKNSPKLLNRCLNSIPRRDDVEIIVLDDNSNPDVVNWENFEFDNPKGITLIRNYENVGQGYLRNIGIDLAKGQWLLFPDADDYYNEGFLDKLDSFKNLSVDVVYFNARTVYSNGLYSTHTIRCVDNYDESDISVKKVKYGNNAAWWKMVNREFAQMYSVRFEQIRIGEDALFTILVGFFAKKIVVCKDVLYNYINTTQSITAAIQSDDKYIQIVENIFKHNAWCEYIDMAQLITPVWRVALSHFRKGDFRGAYYILKIVLLNRSIKGRSRYYIREIEKRIENI